MASFTREERMLYSPEQNEEFEQEFAHKKFGDRRTELVIIGVLLDKQEIIELLDSALLTNEELKDSKSWEYMKDSFPAWL